MKTEWTTASTPQLIVKLEERCPISSEILQLRFGRRSRVRLSFLDSDQRTITFNVYPGENVRLSDIRDEIVLEVTTALGHMSFK